MEDDYEKLKPVHTMCCETASSLATITIDPSETEALNISIQCLTEAWQKLKHRLNETEDKLQNALDKADDLDRCHKEISGWLTKMLDKLKHLDPCAAQVKLIDDQISEANVCLTDLYVLNCNHIQLFYVRPR